MDTSKLYDKLTGIGEKLYKNDNNAWLELQEVLPQLNEFVSQAAQLSDEMREVVLNCIPKLLDAIEKVDQLLAADTIYYEICEIVEIYKKLKNQRNIKQHEKKNLNKTNIDTTAIFEKNIECLSEKQGKYYQKLEEYCRQFDLSDEEIAVDEYGNIAVLSDDRWWRMNSFYNSEYVAALALEEIQQQNYISCLYVFGMGNMDTVRYLVENVASDTIVFIYEPNPKILGINSYYHDWSEILCRDNVLLFVEGLNEEELGISTYVRMDNVAFQYSYVYIQPEYRRVYPDEIDERMQECRKMIRDAVFTDNTIDKYAEKFNYNRIMNTPLIYKSVLISDIKRFLAEKTDMNNAVAVLVAAGPSLDENMEYLKKIKGRAFILAVDSAIRMCEEHGVRPDAFVTIDPQKQEILFENETANQTPLIWGLPSVYKQVRNLQGRKVFCNCDISAPKEIAIRVEAISPGGSVSNTAFSILDYLGFHKIIAIGLDLAFLKDKKHASVVYDDGGINEEERKNYTEVKGQNGETLLTYMNFMSYKDNIEKRIEVKKDTLTFINSSKGAYIEGAIHMPFTEAIEKYVPVENIDFERLIKECPDSFSLEEKENIEKVMQSYVEECEKIYDNYEQCHQLYAQLKNENSIDNIQQAMQTIDELYVKSEKCFTGRLIADASSMEADTVLEAMYKESTNQEKCSKEYLGSVADKGMQMADIFMKNARKTEELFKKSMESI